MKTESFEEFAPQLTRVVVDKRICENKATFALNSQGVIILLGDDKITVIFGTGEDIMLPNHTESNVIIKQEQQDITVDCKDNVYAVIRLKTREKNGSVKVDYVLFVFDEHYNIKHVSVLDFFCTKTEEYPDVKIAVDEELNLVMIAYWNQQVNVCGNTGKLKFQFQVNAGWPRHVSICNNNDVMVVSDGFSVVQTYTTEGVLKYVIKPPQGHKIISVEFHHGIGKIIVITYIREKHSWYLLSYSKTGELENSLFLHKLDSFLYSGEISLKSHPRGKFAAIAIKDSLFFI